MNSNAPYEVTAWYLENTRGSHNKFYAIYLDEIAPNRLNTARLTFQWGPIGSAGQTNVTTLEYGDALTKATHQYKSKLGGGYESIHEGIKLAINPAWGPLRTINVLAEARSRYDWDLEPVDHKSFALKVDSLMSGMSSPDRHAADVLTELDELEKAWAQLTKNQEQSAVALDMVRNMFGAKLMGG